jgi:ABC-type antimicrobial peptide transport system permease subunit
MDRLLFGVTARDPWIFGGVALVMMAVALLAAYIPAGRAIRISPMAAPHCE